MSIHVKDPTQGQARGCVIWMHGLGADATDMMGVAEVLPVTVPLRHVFLDAPVRPVTLNNRMPMRAWFDILGMKITDREDRAGIVQSEAMIADVIKTQRAEGFADDTLFLAGFSQGAAMALFTGLRATSSLGGIIALSGYLPLATEIQTTLAPDTPIFVGSGDHDPIVLPAWTSMSVQQLKDREFSEVTWHRYLMEHAICPEEIRDIGRWISTVLMRKDS